MISVFLRFAPPVLLVLCGFLVSVPTAQADTLNKLLKGAAGAIILNEAIKSQKRQPSQSGTVTSRSPNQGAVPAGPAYSRPEKRDIQSALNTLGYNAGPVDGSFGRQTRAAIRRFQTENGYPATGRLERVQFDALRGIAAGGTGAAVQVSVDENRTLDRGEVRLLQSALKSLGYYTGRIDGQAGRGTGGAVSRFLTERGHDPYTTSAVLALSMAAAEAGQPLPEYLVREVAAISGAAATEAAAAEVADASAYSHIFHGTPSQGAMKQRMYLYAIKANPAMLEDDRFLENEASGWRDVFDYEVPGYGRMNQLEKENARAAIREKLRADADALPPLDKAGPWKLALYTPTGIREFQESAGLVLRHGDLNSLPRFAQQRRDDPWGIEVRYSHAPTPQTVGIARAPAEALWEKVQTDRKARPSKWAYVVTFVTVEDIRLKEQSVAQRVSDTPSNTVEVVLRTDAIELHTAEQGQYAPRAPVSGTPLHSWSVNKAGAASRGSVIAWARGNGFTVVAGHLGIGSEGDGVRDLVYKLRLNQEPEIAQKGNNFERIAGSLMNRNQQEAFFGEHRYSADRGYPVEGGAQRQSYFRDEFARREAKQIFFDEYFDDLRRVDPPWPLPFVRVIRASISEYDFDREQFSVYYHGTKYDYATLSPENIAQLSRLEEPDFYGEGSAYSALGWKGSGATLSGLPLLLPTPIDEARVISDKVTEDRGRDVYLGVFYSAGAPDLREIEAKDRNGTYTTLVSPTEPTRVALFYDQQLTQVIREFDLEEVMRAPPVPEPEPEAEPAAQVQEDEAPQYAHEVERILREEYFYSKDDLLGFMYRAHADYGEQFFEANRALSEANEFDYADARAALEAEMRTAMPEEGWVQLTLRFGTYDLEAETMPVTAWGVGILPQDWRKITGEFEAQLPETVLGRAIPLPRDTARKIAEMRDRQVQALAWGRFLPGDMEVVNSQPWLKLRPVFVPDEVILLQGEWYGDRVPFELQRIALVDGNAPVVDEDPAPGDETAAAVEETGMSAPAEVVEAEAEPLFEVEVASDQDVLGVKLGLTAEEARTALTDKRQLRARYGATGDHGGMIEAIGTGPHEGFALLTPEAAAGILALARHIEIEKAFDADKISEGLTRKYGAPAQEMTQGQGRALIWASGAGCAVPQAVVNFGYPLAMRSLDPNLPDGALKPVSAVTRAQMLAREAEDTLRAERGEDACETVVQAAWTQPEQGGPTALSILLYAPRAARDLAQAKAGAAAAGAVEIDF